ncbi:ufm1-specific protease 2-like isoform X2 [Anneissia japonica]|uniref:ufm1-specific protease 2-like isoform X2 n=1 Tax=Anneissia japonica TaxID=1529436 RepID=UPI001425AD54|nr:ufm1-specific protease 2-like isoform X2 [Anneissia japonica]
MRLNCYQPENGQIGFLLGNYSKKVITILSCSSCGSSDSLDLKFSETIELLPGGISVVGVLFQTQEDADINLIKQFCHKNVSKEFESLCNTEYLVVCCVSENVGSIIPKENVFLYNLEQHDVTLAQVNAESSPVDLLTFRITADLPVKFTTNEKADLLSTAISHIALLKQDIQSDRAVFQINNSEILMADEQLESLHTSLEPNDVATNILDHIEEKVEDSFSRMKGKKSKKKTSGEQVVDVSLMLQITQSPQKAEAPVAYYKSGLSQEVSFHLPVNAIVQTPGSTPACRLAGLFITCICRQLTAMTMCMQKYSANEICLARPYHFKPLGCDPFITILYPDGKTDEELESKRSQLHELLLLPQDRPLLRRCNAYRFPADKKGNVYLENTHIGLKNDGSDGSKVYLVHGTYSYHHYMQDKFNDDKWGCAYRSLQTIVSWFRHQGYTDVPVPSHRVIQQTLVDVGDKDANFVGSKKWIGSIEVCTVLNQLLEVTSKIMFVNTGSEMANKGRELAQHFEIQGTPIMIGGGVLAHTILGVDFNEKSGEIRFLILDPHYTGSEDIKVIQDKGWCGWKGPDFWDQNVFYNLCLPQRPKVI